MTDEGQYIQRFDWRQALPFTHLFRAFRIAIHPSKLALGLALLLTVFIGGSLMDAFWPANHLAVANEIALYQDNSPTDFEELRAVVASGEREGPFHAFFEYQANQFNGVVRSVLTNEWPKTDEAAGVFGHVYNFVVVGPLWLIRVHVVFGILFYAIFLGAWSLFGGAISRLAAVHVARDEKIPIRQALNFAVGKFLSFASAPIIPLLIVLVVGALLILASLVGNIPFLGPIIVGGAFFLALLGGFVQTLVILGTIGGFGLMYPTVAVEGSDSFDAISRSFSYVYARPWRMLFYTAVGVGYGAITYLFVRMSILLMLKLAHHFVNLGIFLHVPNGSLLLPAMWPSPAVTGRLTYHVNFAQLNWSQKIGAGLLSFWIHLVVGILGAFAISFYFSIDTIIYYLMRHQLDATEMDDVYLEQSEDDFSHASAGDTAATETATVETVVSESSTAPPVN